jgi:cell wall-associated NlpC family hydrolase
MHHLVRHVIASAITVGAVVSPILPAAAQDLPVPQVPESTTTLPETVPESTTTLPETVPESTTTLPETVPESTTTLPAPQVGTTVPPEDPPDAGPRPWSYAPQITEPDTDDLVAALELLRLVDAEIAAVSARRTQAIDRVARQRRHLDALRNSAADLMRRADEVHERRRSRAVNAYVNADALTGARLDVFDDRARIVASMQILDSAAGDQVQELRTRSVRASADADDIERSFPDLAEQTTSIDEDLVRLRSGRAQVVDKIDGTFDEAAPVPAGPAQVAQAASAADAKRKSLMAARLVGPMETLAARQELDASLASLGAAIDETKGPAIAAELAAVDDRRLGVVLFALAQVGKPYVWAASGPGSYDCSGLVMRAWATAGLRLAHFSGTQAASGPAATRETIRAGDVLGYGPGSSEHITMYVAAGVVVEAKGRAYGVVVAPARFNADRLTHLGGAPYRTPGQQEIS